MNFIPPSSDRGDRTRWRLTHVDGSEYRIERCIDTDGDEHWTVSRLRGDTWSPMPKLAGRNREAGQKIRQHFDCYLYERDELPPAADEQRIRMDVYPHRDEERSETFSGPRSPWEVRS
jgi:hypothetical protein